MRGVQTKICKNEDTCIHPDGPVLPLSEFYKNPGSRDGLLGKCKPCHTRQTSEPSAHKCRGSENEVELARMLSGMGIPTFIGNEYRNAFRFVDLVAWGSVKIEVKTGIPHRNPAGNEYWKFGFSSQRRSGIKSDVVILAPLTSLFEVISYHVFKSDHYAFYKDGWVKSGVHYTPNPSHRKNAYSNQLSPALMAQHQDAWHLIEEKRLEIQQRLINGESL